MVIEIVLTMSVLAADATAFTRQTVVKGLKHPWSIAFLPEGGALVTEKDGQLQRVDLKSGQTEQVQGFPSDLDNVRGDDPRDNSGLFDVVLHPQFAKNRLIYVSYASKGEGGTTTRVIRARYRHPSLDQVTPILEVKPRSPDRFHYGGGMVFGPDGLLYVTIGERLFNESDQPSMPIAQNSKDGRGKIYRLRPDGNAPPGNPKFDKGSPSGMYATGIRAAQGLAAQPGTGAIWFSEHGSRQGDELNVLKAGANYGWPVKTTGSFRSPTYVAPKLRRKFTDPVWYWSQTVAPTGLTFYRGSIYPEWQNDLFVAGLSRGSLWRFDVDGTRIVNAEELFPEERIRLRNVKLGPDGFLYLLTDEPQGRVMRIERAKSG
ncbi:MAG: PQQ-dependent sugar dehydrogenase [Myxococcota bacterium]